jgi:hypothetical protein
VFSPSVRCSTEQALSTATLMLSKLSGEEPTSYLEREGIKLADFERWRIA